MYAVSVLLMCRILTSRDTNMLQHFMCHSLLHRMNKCIITLWLLNSNQLGCHLVDGQELCRITLSTVRVRMVNLSSMLFIGSQDSHCLKNQGMSSRNSVLTGMSENFAVFQGIILLLMKH